VLARCGEIIVRELDPLHSSTARPLIQQQLLDDPLPGVIISSIDDALTSTEQAGYLTAVVEASGPVMATTA
jgi:hypothetical protein